MNTILFRIIYFVLFSSVLTTTQSSPEMKPIGIDLGTTNSCVGVWINGKVEIIHNEQGTYITPSYVAFTETQRLIGNAAKNQAATNPENTVFEAKRMIGRKFEDVKLQKDMKLWPFTVIDENGSPKVQVEYKGETKIYSPEEISSMVLIKLKEIAETYLKEEVKDVVITVPAYFNNAQREATKDAGKIAGLNVLAMISEPTAAALAYGLDKCQDGKRNVLIYDLGGGTFDVSIMTIEGGSSFDVKSTSGDTNLGGGDFDNVLVKHFVEEIKRKHNKDITDNKRAMGRLRKEAEKAKKTLSSSIEAELNLEAFDGIDFQSKISRVRFEELCKELFESTLEPVKQALEDVEMDKSDIDDVVLVGGSIRIPKIQSIIQEFFDGKTLTMNINADEAVGWGAALFAATSSKQKRDYHLPKIFLNDITPLSLGIETVGGNMAIVVPRNSKIPCEMHEKFTTSWDNQDEVPFFIYEGERLLVKHNNELGKFTLSGIPPAQEGVPEISVTFALDADGILNVSAKDVSTGGSSNIVITINSGRLSKDEIKRMIAEAEQCKEDDAREKKKIIARSELEKVIFKGKEMAFNVENNLNKSDKSEILTRCNELMLWLDENYNTESEIFEEKSKNLRNFLKPLMTRA